MDLERTLCFAAAKINRIIYTGNVMVIVIQIQTYSTCNTSHDNMVSQHQDHIYEIQFEIHTHTHTHTHTHSVYYTFTYCVYSQMCVCVCVIIFLC